MTWQEQLARDFHEAYEELAPTFGYETRTNTKQFDPESKNGKLMIAVCERVATNLLSQKSKEIEKKIDRAVDIFYPEGIATVYIRYTKAISIIKKHLEV